MSTTEDSLSQRNVRFIVLARGFSDFGFYLSMIALTTYAYFLSKNVFYVSLFLACRVAGGLMASGIGGIFFRHFKGKFSLVAWDMMRGGLVALLLFVPASQQLLILPFIALGSGLGGSMFLVGLNSRLPSFVHPDVLVSTNARMATVSAMGVVLGSLVAGLLVASYGYPLVFGLNSVIYLLAALMVLPLKCAFFSERPLKELPQKKERFLRILQHSPMLASMTLLTMADTLGSAAHNVGLPLLSHSLMPTQPSRSMGSLLAVWAVGKFIGARLAQAFHGRVGMEWLFFLGVVVMSLGFIGVFQQTHMPWALAFALGAGVGDGLSEVSLVSRAQREPDHIRLSLFSLLTFMQMTGFGIGMFLVAPFFVWWSPAHVVLLFHGFPLSMVVLVLLLLPFYKKKLSIR